MQNQIRLCVSPIWHSRKLNKFETACTMNQNEVLENIVYILTPTPCSLCTLYRCLCQYGMEEVVNKELSNFGKYL